MENKEKIKKEIERRIEICEKYSQLNLTTSTRNGNHTQLLELRKIKDFIDSLPEEEPIVKGLTWKDVNTLDTLIDQVRHEFPNGISEKSFGLAVLEKFQDYHDDAEEPVSEDLDREIGYYTTSKLVKKQDHSTGVYHLTQKECDSIARHFAEWQRKQLAENAVEGVIDIRKWPAKAQVEFYDRLPVFNVRTGDKVKIIILKED